MTKKTELIYLSSKHKTQTLPDTGVRVGQSEIRPSAVVRDMGAYFDQHLQMDEHVNSIVRKASIGLRRIGKLRPFLDEPATEKLVAYTRL